MKTLRILSTLLLAVALLGSCQQTEVNVPSTVPSPSGEEPLLEVAWATRLNYEKDVANLADGVSYKDWYIYPGDFDDPATLMAFHKDTGDKEWELLLSELSGKEIGYMFLSGDYLLAKNAHHVFGVDLRTRSLAWSVDLKSMGMRLGRSHLAENGKLYHLADFGWQTPHQEARLYEFEPATGAYRLVYAEQMDSIGMKYLSPPAYHRDEANNRELLLFNHRPNAENVPQEISQRLYAIDLSSGEKVWDAHVTNAFASNGLHPPVIYDNRIVITGGDWSLYAFDVQTGEQLWRYHFDYPWAIWGYTNHLLHEGRLYVNNSQFDVSCLNPETGQLIWNNPEGGPNSLNNMVYYEREDWLVFTSWGYGSVMVLDALTGETLHRERGYNYSTYNNDVVYDEARDMFFTSTFRHAVGFKPRSPE
ncbi:outer membrane protein assembly factor BamB family protein [Phaeodactylibacter luteus]|uniref:PQQ-binding-like beta-propeller repeat protein n=1 Tax=Phaeodactylibacter luteus TaxID=1564516 RepID=A0A5C6S1T8_9BACT|nr:PQQ-binding-like beta-propeller repeat protein [Phaeodactylibacter luteus]TXB68397.1 PQQ-binding-like beta-propeller repeat protein [Phaeodactylibacter luteus]